MSMIMPRDDCFRHLVRAQPDHRFGDEAQLREDALLAAGGQATLVACTACCHA
jgi:hypothetical protein